MERRRVYVQINGTRRATRRSDEDLEGTGHENAQLNNHVEVYYCLRIQTCEALLLFAPRTTKCYLVGMTSAYGERNQCQYLRCSRLPVTAIIFSSTIMIPTDRIATKSWGGGGECAHAGRREIKTQHPRVLSTLIETNASCLHLWYASSSPCCFGQLAHSCVRGIPFING